MDSPAADFPAATTDGESALARLAANTDTPMAVVTAATPDGERSGCLVGFWTQCSIHPPRVLVCVSKSNHTCPVASAADVLAVHWLADGDRRLAELFGGETGDDIDKFEHCSWQPGPGGVPVLAGPKGWVAGPVVNRIDVGDHIAFVIDAVSGDATDASADQMGFQAVKGLEPGHEP